jgi:radical SAM superfamily enzyme YgiQ (UPF0313 family)
MKILLVHPKFPTTYWGFQYGLPLVRRRASLPPLGLITLAALLPRSWNLRLVDLNVLNVEDLTDDDLRWADAVFVGGMRVQAPSIHEVLGRGRAAGRTTVVGGSAPTMTPEEFDDSDIIFVGEAEGRVEELVAALNSPRRSGSVRLQPPPGWHAPLTRIPAPRFDLLDLRHYASMSIQYSRGCPFKCEFCDVVQMFGRTPRVKTATQVLAELNALYELGFRGSLFLVDDNFIGNSASVKRLLPELTAWQRLRGYPFQLYTEASVNLAADRQLVDGMLASGFSAVFLGIETTSPETLKDAGKKQNARIDLAGAVRQLTRTGLEVFGGFILGFDNDTPDVFASQRDFITGLPLPLAMVGVLTALPGTLLWRRLQREGRLRQNASGDQFGRPNFEPTMAEKTLLSGYAGLLADLYEPEAYYRRCEAFIKTAPALPGRKRSERKYLGTLLRTLFTVGLRRPYRRHFWRLLACALRHAPHQLAWAVGHAVMGEHLIRYTREDVLPRLRESVLVAREGNPVATSATGQFCD